MQSYEINSNDASQNYNKFELASIKERELMTKFFTKYRIFIYDFTPIESYDRHDGTFKNKKDDLKYSLT